MTFRWSDAPAAVLAALTAAFASWGAWFANHCFSDGCLGVIVLAGISLAVLLVQALIALPIQAWLLHRAGLPAGRRYILWFIISLAAFVVPLAMGYLFDGVNR